jgi:hypothetical protein
MTHERAVHSLLVYDVVVHCTSEDMYGGLMLGEVKLLGKRGLYSMLDFTMCIHQRQVGSGVFNSILLTGW